MSLRHLAAWIAAFVVAASSVAQAAPRYRLTDLGADTEAVAINEHGQVAGNDNGTQAVWTAGQWSGVQGPGGISPVVVAINAGGTAVGYQFRDDGMTNGVLWNPGAQGIVLPPLEASTGTLASGIADDGTVVGTYLLPDDTHAAMWQHGTFVDLGTFGGRLASADAIDPSGLVVGGIVEREDGLRHGFLYTGGTVTDFGALGGAEATVAGVTRQGRATGSAYKGFLARHTRAYFYDGTALHYLPTLGGFESHGHALNEQGTIVGEAKDANRLTQAFVYRAGQIYAIEQLVDNPGQWRFVRANGINAAGQIVGLAADRQRHWHGFLLDPIAP
jgi:probable HAF family extracellular repeat protein